MTFQLLPPFASPTFLLSFLLPFLPSLFPSTFFLSVSLIIISSFPIFLSFMPLSPLLASIFSFLPGPSPSPSPLFLLSPFFFSLRLPLPLNIPFLSSLSNFLLPSQFPFPHLSLSSSPSPFLHLPLLFLTSLSLSLSSSPSPFLLIHMLRPNKRRDPLIRRTHKPGTNTHVSLHSMTSSP